MNGVIYMYTSPSGKQYIGQTINERRRKLSHARAKSKGVFHRAVKKYGMDSFKYEVLHSNITSRDTLDILEMIEIKSRQTMVPNGYNMKHGGLSGRFSIMARKKMSDSHKTPEYLEHIRRTRTGVDNEKNYKPVVCIETGEVFQSRKHAASAKQCMPSHIARCLDKPNMSIGGFHWASSIESADQMKPNLTSNTKAPNVKVQCYQTGEIFDTLISAAKYCGRAQTTKGARYAGRCIRDVMDNPERTAYGYHWVTPGKSLQNPRVGGGRKKWIQCVETGEVFQTVTDASNSVNVTVTAISQAAKKGRMSKGYHWVYC